MNISGNTSILIPQQIQADFGSIFTSETFKQFCVNEKIKLTLAAPKHLEMNSILERTWQSLCQIKNSMIVHERVDETATHFSLKYATEVFSVIPIRTIRKNGILTTPHELFTGKRPNIRKFRVLFSPCVVKKYTATRKTDENKYITMDVSKQCTQKGVRGMFVGFDDYTSGYLGYVPSIRKVVMSVDVVFDENFITALAYKNRVF